MAINNYQKHFHKKRKKKSQHSSIDRLIYVAVILGPLMTIPQVYDIWILGRTEVSIISWTAYLLIAGVWLFYGMKHKDMPIITVQIIWIVMDAAVVSGLIIS